mmetsp:Transcript_37131/g.88278  ORF Transcript_37131/g.88278 Transcript_37131/m.88278 type:complete len:200 (+) Transcript_37131:196-795(+)
MLRLARCSRGLAPRRSGLSRLASSMAAASVMARLLPQTAMEWLAPATTLNTSRSLKASTFTGIPESPFLSTPSCPSTLRPHAKTALESLGQWRSPELRARARQWWFPQATDSTCHASSSPRTCSGSLLSVQGAGSETGSPMLPHWNTRPHAVTATVRSHPHETCTASSPRSPPPTSPGSSSATLSCPCPRHLQSLAPHV